MGSARMPVVVAAWIITEIFRKTTFFVPNSHYNSSSVLTKISFFQTPRVQAIASTSSKRPQYSK
jgi:hypothetical protein